MTGGIRRTGTVAILNGFGRVLGDTIIGLQALAVAVDRCAVGERPVLFRLPGLGAVIDGLYAAAGDFAETRDLPWDDATRERPFAGAAGFDHVIDIRDFAFDPGFHAVPMIDYFLGKLGVDPVSVPAAERRNAWLKPRIPPSGHASGRGVLDETPAGRAERDYVLVCPTSNSPLRNMPAPVHDRILAWFAARDVPVLTQATLPRCDSLAELCRLVAGARLVVSTDTGMVHLADALEVPCLAFFVTHRPVWRVRDYPLCTAVHVPAHDLPEALEFPRDDEDVARAEAAWLQTDRGLSWIDAALDGVSRHCQ